MDIVPTVLMCLSALLMGGLFGAFFVAPFEAQGPRSLRGHFLSAVVFALFVPIIPVLIWGLGVYSNGWDGKSNIAMFATGAIAMLFTAWATALVSALTANHIALSILVCISIGLALAPTIFMLVDAFMKRSIAEICASSDRLFGPRS